MKIRLICAECTRLLKVPEEALGKKILCPACGSKFIGDPALVRVKKGEPWPTAAGPAPVPERTRPEQPPPRAMPPAAAPSPPPSSRQAPVDFPRLELDSSHTSRPPEPEMSEIVESLEEPMLVEEVIFLKSEAGESEVVDLTETHPEVLESEVVPDLEDDVIVPEVVEPAQVEAVEAVEPEIVDEEAAEPMVIEEATLEPEVVEAVEPEIVEAAEPEVVEAVEPEVVEAAALEPEIAESVIEEAGEPEVVDAVEEDEPVRKKPAKKKSGGGLLIILLLVGFVLLLAGGGVAAYFLYLVDQAKTTAPNNRMAGNSPQGLTIPEGEWKPFSPQGGNFTVQMPGTPRSASNPGGKSFGVNRQEGTFNVTYTDLEQTENDPKAALERKAKEQRDAFAATSKNKSANEQGVQLQGAEGRDLAFEGQSNYMLLIRLLVSRQGNHYRMYRLSASGPNYRVDSGDAGKFFRSFQVQPGQ